MSVFAVSLTRIPPFRVDFVHYLLPIILPVYYRRQILSSAKHRFDMQIIMLTHIVFQ